MGKEIILTKNVRSTDRDSDQAIDIAKRIISLKKNKFEESILTDLTIHVMSYINHHDNTPLSYAKEKKSNKFSSDIQRNSTFSENILYSKSKTLHSDGINRLHSTFNKTTNNDKYAVREHNLFNTGTNVTALGEKSRGPTGDSTVVRSPKKLVDQITEPVPIAPGENADGVTNNTGTAQAGRRTEPVLIAPGENTDGLTNNTGTAQAGRRTEPVLIAPGENTDGLANNTGTAQAGRSTKPVLIAPGENTDGLTNNTGTTQAALSSRSERITSEERIIGSPAELVVLGSGPEQIATEDANKKSKTLSDEKLNEHLSGLSTNTIQDRYSNSAYPQHVENKFATKKSSKNHSPFNYQHEENAPKNVIKYNFTTWGKDKTVNIESVGDIINLYPSDQSVNNKLSSALSFNERGIKYHLSINNDDSREEGEDGNNRNNGNEE